ncbi:MAG TPA: hypothetical protein VFW33_15055 [Gemmataceae bacterium]|nr:hypothetical protein [Gemmataceae bacterium]
MDYGYVLDRLPEGGWWHMHFGRSRWVYRCELLDRETDMLACVRRFGVGAVAQSPRFLLTLDGEGVELPADGAGVDYRWGQHGERAKLADDAGYFQREVMPLLHDSPEFQRAVAAVVSGQRHWRVVAVGKLFLAAAGKE